MSMNDQAVTINVQRLISKSWVQKITIKKDERGYFEVIVDDEDHKSYIVTGY